MKCIKAFKRVILFFVPIVCSIVWGTVPAAAQDFLRQQIGTVNYTTPILQMRFNSVTFNPPQVFDLGDTTARQNILQTLSLGGFTTTFQVTPATANRIILWPDGGGTVALMPAAGGQITTNGTAIGAGTCQAQPAITINGVTTTSAVDWSVPTALPATWQTGIHVMPVVTANTVTLSLCNASAGSITPAAQAVNIRAIL